MIALICFVLAVLALPFKSKGRLEAENAALRHQLIVLRRKVRGRAQLSNNDRWFFVQLYRWFPSILQVVTILRPETLRQPDEVYDRDRPHHELLLGTHHRNHSFLDTGNSPKTIWIERNHHRAVHSL
jgi:hypothetical protein